MGTDSNKFGVKKYSNINERYTARHRFSTKLYDLINKKVRKKAVEIGGKIIKKRFDKKVDTIIKYKVAVIY